MRPEVVDPRQVGLDPLGVGSVPVGGELRLGFQVGRHLVQQPWDLQGSIVRRPAVRLALGHGAGQPGDGEAQDLPGAHAHHHVERDGIARDHRQRLVHADVAGGAADHHAQFHLVIVAAVREAQGNPLARPDQRADRFQEEALLFAQQTGISAPLTAGAKLRAKIHGGDSEAIAFLSATQRAGFGLSFNQSHAKWKIACIATAFGEYRQHGERIYTDALRVLAEAWEGDIDSLRSEVLQGVVRFVALYDHEYDPIRLIRQLQRTSPVAIYRSGQAMTGPNYQKYMLQILKAYNGSSRTKSLPIKQ